MGRQTQKKGEEKARRARRARRYNRCIQMLKLRGPIASMLRTKRRKSMASESNCVWIVVTSGSWRRMQTQKKEEEKASKAKSEKVLGMFQVKIIPPNAFTVMAVDMWRKEDLRLRVLLECRHSRV